MKDREMSEPISFHDCLSNQKECQALILRKMEKLDEKFDTMNEKLTRLDQTMKNGEQSKDRSGRWITWAITTGIAILGMMAALFKVFK